MFQALEIWLWWKSVLYEHSLLLSTWYHFQFSFLILSYAWFCLLYQFGKSLCELKILLFPLTITSSPLLKANPNLNWLDEDRIRSLSTDSLFNSAGGWEDKFVSAQALIRKLKENSPEETSAWFRIKKQITLQKKQSYFWKSTAVL